MQVNTHASLGIFSLDNLKYIFVQWTRRDSQGFAPLLAQGFQQAGQANLSPSLHRTTAIEIPPKVTYHLIVARIVYAYAWHTHAAGSRVPVKS